MDKEFYTHFQNIGVDYLANFPKNDNKPTQTTKATGKTDLFLIKNENFRLNVQIS